MMMIKFTGHKLITKNDSMNLHDIFHLFLSKACEANIIILILQIRNQLGEATNLPGIS